MADIVRDLADLLLLLPTNVTRDISEQDLRDFLVSVYSGFASYDDQASKTTPVVGMATVELPVTIDKLGSNTNEARLPHGVSSPMWNSTLNRFEFDGLNINDMVIGRFDFIIATGSPNAEIEVVFEFFNSSDGSIGQSTYKMPEIKAVGAHRMFMVLPIFIDTSLYNGSINFRILCSVNFTISFGSMLAMINR